VRTWNLIQGTTLARLKHIHDDVYIYKPASHTMTQIKCTHCPEPHSKKNANCWATTHAGDPPQVITAPRSHFYTNPNASNPSITATITTLEQFPSSSLSTVKLTPITH
jgi:hypothetical protein